LEATLSHLSFLVGHPIPSAPEVADSARNQGGDVPSSVKIDVIDKLEDDVNQIASHVLSRMPTNKVSDHGNHTTPLTSSVQYFELESGLDPLFPTRAQTKILWRQFREIADQQIKIAHRPQAELSLWRVCTNDALLSSNEIGLAFAIYFAAIVGMSNDDINTTLGVSKSTAISTYQQAAEQAVMKANSLSNQSLMTLQAMTILAAFSRYVKDDKKAWPLTGMARRLNPASSTTTGMAFEMEMRRRIWWQLWYLDHRAKINDGEEAELGIISQVPEVPANVLDEDLDPSMISIPPSRDGWTPVSFSLMNFTIGQAALNVDGVGSWKAKRAIIDHCERRVQVAYLRHCTNGGPIHWLATHVARVHFTELRMKLHAQQNHQIITTQVSSVDRNRLVVDVTDILDVPSRLQKEPQAHKWKWTLNSFPHFTHLSFLLNEISQLQLLPPPSQFWAIAEQAFSRAETAMPASVKNKQILRLSKQKAEEGMKLLLEWQRLADEVDSGRPLHACTPEAFGELDVSGNSMVDMFGLPANVDPFCNPFNSFDQSDISLDSALFDINELPGNFSNNSNGSNT
jgi:hypothetical protein